MPCFPLRPYQQKSHDALKLWLKYRKDNGYIKAAGGGGKSILIAAAAEYCFDLGKKVVVLTRSEKLLTQNKAKLHHDYQNHAGLYCASISEKTLGKPITMGTIQSLVSQGGNIKADIVLVDEVHNIHPDSESETQYWSFFNALDNPQIIGFTATDWRTGSGKLSFGRKIYDIPFAELVEAKFLIPPINKAVANPDLSKVQIIRGEYSEGQLEDVYLEPELLAKTIEVLQKYTADRHTVLIFTQTRKHGKVLKEAMGDNGMIAEFVDGTMDKIKVVNPILERFAKMELKYLINVAMLVEGVDIPQIDCVCVFLSTMSKGKFEQILYRGTRLCPELNKTDFLVLDMGGNFATHGALGTPYQGGGGKEQKKSQGKICPQCETFVSLTAIDCADCGFVFPKQDNVRVSHNGEPDFNSNMNDSPIVTYDVTDIAYREHRKVKNGVESRSLRIDFYCPDAERGMISKWLSPYSDSEWARRQVTLFFSNGDNPLGSDPKSYSMDDLLWHAARLKKIAKLTVDTSKKFPEIIKYEYGENEESGIGDTAQLDYMASGLSDDQPIPF